MVFCSSPSLLSSDLLPDSHPRVATSPRLWRERSMLIRTILVRAGGMSSHRGVHSRPGASSRLMPRAQRTPTRQTPAPLRRGTITAQLASPPPSPTGDSEVEHASLTLRADASASSAFLQPSHYEARLSTHHHHAQTMSPQFSLSSSPSSSTVPVPHAVDEHAAQQGVLRDVFHHAYTHYNVSLRKDKRVYAQEVRAFRQAHGGRAPHPHEVSKYTRATLAPVAALHALRHLDARRAPLHDAVQQAVVLQEAITKNNLVQSRDKTLVRCLRCFHVYSARPRTLWGDEVGQSWLDVEKEVDKAARAKTLAMNPKRRKRLCSVGRQDAQRLSDPHNCPQCGSRRAQWLMEYVHHSTHVHGADRSNRGTHE